MGFNNNEQEEKNFIEYQFETEPSVNVITKEQFEQRMSKVFDILYDKLSKSFGPGGAGTFISVYPAYYNTKDGFTIMKNISFDKKLDQVICDIAMSICNRLNFTVGDGTTTAIIATRSIYNAYRKNFNKIFNNEDILPRDILKILNQYKDEILKEIDKEAISIQTEDSEELRSYIEKVVRISSNNNEELTEMISNLYAELKYPAISVLNSPDGITRSYLIEGYKLDISLTDKLYINNDNNSLILNDTDFIMFDHKVGRETYEKILKPLSAFSHQLGRRLVCIAPYYDETTLHSIISRDLNNEFKATGTINLVLTVCSKISGNAKLMLNDLAMLLNTSLITTSMEDELLEALNNGNSVNSLFNINDRNIEGINVFAINDKGELGVFKYDNNLKMPKSSFNEEIGIRIGFAKKSEIGMKASLFSGFYYDNKAYDSYVKDAKDQYNEIKKKCETMGVFSIELNEKQRRYFALGLKTGIIEVGGTSELSAGYLKDTADDAVKAAASAYNNGIVPGCNLTIIRSIDKYIKTSNSIDNLHRDLLNILYQGFYDVYAAVLSNVYTDTELIEKIINTSIENKKVYNIETKAYSDSVINSAETDKEILKATIDLISLIITGNQLVLR